METALRSGKRAGGRSEGGRDDKMGVRKMSGGKKVKGLSRVVLSLVLVLTCFVPAGRPALAQNGGGHYSTSEIVAAGHRFFGRISQGLATVVERAVSHYGQPNGYILGEEGGGAFVAGLRYGEGILYTKFAPEHRVYWQGPSLGWDVGGDGARTMMLIYNLGRVEDIFRRYVGVNGSAYLVGGFGMTVLKNDLVYVVPIRSGVGARLGINIGYLKFTDRATWNPF